MEDDDVVGRNMGDEEDEDDGLYLCLYLKFLSVLFRFAFYFIGFLFWFLWLIGGQCVGFIMYLVCFLSGGVYYPLPLLSPPFVYRG